ncbi:unnamed protein product [Didymodactylos carnosus]|uniref:Uncharacterized protein n=1 Tax=Didymodactylos carnosus TaxID=1234261 RepID=A0A814MQF4_9BILA|nr:unnamed protein product [Didymodactylos carnosus]CAF1082120.1 unnamed protein product [Didymodactylos carnosus]CAF3704878.1 unnamed protein product [Didymodactylos carnosus]CAF3847858.1 unnamed protein product [Didymodactylos carnosus]
MTRAYLKMTDNTSNNNKLFTFNSYDEFKQECLRMNNENTIDIWNQLPIELPSSKKSSTNNVKYFTRRQQHRYGRKLKYYATCCLLLKKTQKKRKKLRTKIFHLYDEMFNVPHMEQNDCLVEMCQQVAQKTREFISKGELYDSSIDMDELFQAARNIWFLCGLYIRLDRKMYLTDAVFGYSMLYPYTDNFTDSNDITKECKQEFAKIFFQRLLYGEEYAAVPESLKLLSDRIKKIFDMVKFIENDWPRESYKEVYYGLAYIHESQVRSTQQHACSEDGYQPTMELIEEISAQKGPASMLAGWLLVEGHLTYEKTAFLEYFGFGIQLVDDLQDVKVDLKNNHRTIFTQTITDGHMLDEPTAKLIHYFYHGKTAYAVFEDTKQQIDSVTVPTNEHSTITFEQYTFLSTMSGVLMLIFEAASKLKQYYSKKCYHHLSHLSPIPFRQLKHMQIERRIWYFIRHQWF